VTRVIDLNADIGEECGDDAGLLRVITSASVAAGGHAGGGEVLAATVRLARDSGVAVGAHPSYPDRSGFGRVSRAGDHDSESVRAFVHEQVTAVAAACAHDGIRLAHVKPHGALYADVATDAALAASFLDGIGRALADGVAADAVAVVGPPSPSLAQACARRHLHYVVEAFADRAYAADGSLLPRRAPGAVLTDEHAVLAQVRRIVLDDEIVAGDGSRVRVRAETICLHGDTPGAVRLARLVRSDLEGRGVEIRPPSRSATA
jgi:5-oxoprolinase (ATP-hydrolysing) subunit A